MLELLRFFRDALIDVGSLLNGYTFPIGGITVSLLDIFIGLIAMGIIISVFWKGAQS